MTSLDLGKVMETIPVNTEKEGQTIIPPPSSSTDIEKTTAPAVGADPKTATTETPSTEKMSGKLQTAMRREKQAIERERSAKTREEKAAAKEQELAAREEKIKAFESLKETAPLKALELLGLSYADITEVALKDGNVPEDVKFKRLEDKFNDLEKSSADKKRADEEAALEVVRQSEVRAVDNFKGEIRDYVKANPKKYELIAFEQQEDMVYDIISAHYDRTVDPKTGYGKIMSISEAADRLEIALEKEIDDRAKTAPEKIKNKFLPKAPPIPVVKVERPTLQKPKTLTNQHSATASRPRVGLLTDDERIQKAIAYAKGLRP